MSDDDDDEGRDREEGADEYIRSMEEELDRVWDMLKRLVDASEKPADKKFQDALEEVRDWVQDTT